MTDQTPIERATWALRGEGWELDRDRAHAVFASIDTDQLADVLSTLTTCDGQPHASELHHRQALAVKNWLTGKDNQ